MKPFITVVTLLSAVKHMLTLKTWPSWFQPTAGSTNAHLFTHISRFANKI